MLQSPVGTHVFSESLGGFPKFIHHHSDIPSYWIDSAALDDNEQQVKIGTNDPQTIREGFSYTFGAEAFKGEIDATGGDDMDTGCMEPQLHYRTELALGQICTARYFGCSALWKQVFKPYDTYCEKPIHGDLWGLNPLPPCLPFSPGDIVWFDEILRPDEGRLESR